MAHFDSADRLDAGSRFDEPDAPVFPPPKKKGRSMNIFKLELRNKSVGEIIALMNAHIEAMNGNADFPPAGRKPTDAAFLAGKEALEAAVLEADPAEVAWKAKNKLRDHAEDAAVVLLNTRANDCEATQPGNIPALTGTAFPIRGSALPLPAVTAPQNVRATTGEQEGQMDLMCDSQKAATSYSYQYQQHLATGDWIQAAVVPKSRYTIEGLLLAPSAPSVSAPWTRTAKAREATRH